MRLVSPTDRGRAIAGVLPLFLGLATFLGLTWPQNVANLSTMLNTRPRSTAEIIELLGGPAALSRRLEERYVGAPSRKAIWMMGDRDAFAAEWRVPIQELGLELGFELTDRELGIPERRDVLSDETVSPSRVASRG